ncbi:MAG TPA: methionine--tRNA ligase [Candidatus Saccharimonadales bacterium]|nr:methionine--tRNA ligase [Candidatus Saccharimonadales bacterium]
METPTDSAPDVELQPHESQNVAVLVAWPYGNGPRHLGHGASLLPADVIARYHRSKGDNVLMVSGTDEHGTPNVIAAEKAGLPVRDYVTGTNEIIRNDFTGLGMSFDWFTRTTSKTHERTAQGIFSQLVDADYIAKGEMLGAFDEDTEQSLPDRYVEGECPYCHSCARGDQCESCNSLLDPADLINPVSKLTGNAVSFRQTEHYFLLLDKVAPDVIEWLKSNDKLRSNAKASSIAMAEQLRPRAITRDMSWGIPLPEGYELEGENHKVLYVWFEAVIGYLSASIEWAKNTQDDPNAWKQWWSNPNAPNYYAMGKDNVPFHTIIWPGMLLALNKLKEDREDYLRLPDVIASTEYLTFGDDKLSSSRGNVIYVSDLLRIVGPDALRYYFIAAGPETKDTTFSFHELTKRTNDELIAKWGNLVSRTFSLLNKNHDGKVPEISLHELHDADRELLNSIHSAFATVGENIERNKFSQALKSAIEAASAVNKYIYDNEPWKVAKTDLKEASRIMYVVANAIDNLSVIFSPFLPHSSQRIHQALGYDDVIASQPVSYELDPGTNFSVLKGDYSSNKHLWHYRHTRGGQKIHMIEGGHIFKKIDEEELQRDFQAISQARQLGNTALQPDK